MFTTNKNLTMHIYTPFKNCFSILKRMQKQIVLFAALFILAMQAVAQVPVNDEPCNATVLTATAACSYGTFSNVDASNSTGTGIPNPTCANFTDADVWFTATVPVGATTLTIDTKNIGLTDGGMAIYTATGICPTLTMTELSCADGGSTNPSMPKLTVTQPAGTTVYIRVWGFGGEMGTFGICATANIPPANNECANAQLLTVNANLLCGTVTAGTTNNATQSSTTPAPTCGVASAWNDDVWFKFVATGSNHTISLLNVAGTSTAMVIALYSVPTGGDCTNLTQVNCIAGNILTQTGLTAGANYYVRVYTNVITTATASFNICVGTPPPPPVNDECINATVLTVNPNYNCGITTNGTTVSATQSDALPTPTCSATNGWNDDVWYSFVATNTAHRVSMSNVTGITTDMATAVYSGTCGALTQLACTDPEPNVINLTGLTIGNTYYVRVMTWTATLTSTASFTMCVGTPPPPPPNDNCPNAVSVTVNPNYLCGSTTAGTTISALPTAGVPTPSCNPLGVNDDVWFKFIATNTQHRFSYPGNTAALTTVIYSGTCGALTELTCNGANLFNYTGLIVGDTYYIRVYTTSATVGIETNFSICIGTPPPPPANDECTGAFSLPVNAFNTTPNANQCVLVTAGSTAGATQSATTPLPTCGIVNGWNDDVWYSFTATNINHFVTLSNVNGSSIDMTMAAYSGTCGALTQIGCVNGLQLTLTNLTIGTTYYVRVYTNPATTGLDGNFNICISTPGPGQICNSAWQGICNSSNPSPTSQPSLGTISCLITSPNPTWFIFQVATTGNLVLQLSQTSTAGVGIDIDFAAWGPFPTPSAACTSIAANPGTTVDCSFSASATETCTILNAQAGQFYAVLITNYNGGAGSFTFFPNPTTSTGTIAQGASCSVTALNNGPVCTGGTFNLTSTFNQLGYTFSWTGPNGYTSNLQNPLPITAPLIGGSYIYTVTATSGTSISTSSTTVVVSVPPPVPTVVSPLTYCQGATAPALTAIVTTAGNTLLYYTVVTGGVGVASLIPSTATIGSTTYYVSQKTGSCEGPRTAIVVNVVLTNTPAVAVISPVAYCQGANAASLASNATAATGGSLLWYTTAIGGTGSATVPTPSTTAAGTTTYYVSQIVGSCEGPRTAIVVNVTASSPSPTVTTPVNYCQGIAATPLISTGTNVLWYTVATGGPSSSTIPTPSTATTGTTIYYVTQTSNGCESPRVAITVNVFANPTTPVVVSPVVYCQGATATALTATGTNVTWFTVPTGGVALASAPIPLTTTVGSTIYYVQSNNGTCVSPRAAITVTVNTMPATPTVTSPVSYCQGATAVPLTATGTNLLWYTTATGGTGDAIAPTPITTTVGTTNYYVSSIIGACESPRALIAVTVNATPLAPTVSTPVIYCQNATPTQLSATVSIGTLQWFTVPTGGTALAIAPTPSTTAVGSTIYYVQSANGICISPRSPITVTVNATPLAPTTTPVTYCQLATAIPLTAPGTNLLWYTTLSGGTGVATAPTPITTTVGTTNYYVSSTIGVCEGPRALIVVTVNGTPLVPTVSTPVNYCQNVTANPLTATANIGTLLWYTVPTGGSGLATAPTPSTTTAGSVTYYASAILGTCEGPRTPIVVTVIATPALPIVSNLVTYCTNVIATPLTATGNSLLWYTTATLGIGSTTAPTPLTTVAGTTPYYVSQSTLGVVCEGPRALINVVINPRPAAPIVTPTFTYCQNFNAAILTATGANLLWYTVATGGTGTASAITPSTNVVGSTNYYVSQSALTCEGPRATIVVNVKPELNINAGLDVTIARGDQTQLLGVTTSIGATYLWTANVAPLALTSATILNPIANPIQTTIYTLKITDTSGLCPSKTSDIKVNVVQSCVNVRNAFTPNGDGVNDTWMVYDQNFCLLNGGGVIVTIFNRYGSKVFESKNYTNNWDGTYNGKPLPDGTYYAVIGFTLFDGSRQDKKTDVTILR